MQQNNNEKKKKMMNKKKKMTKKTFVEWQKNEMRNECKIAATIRRKKRAQMHK